MDPTLNPSSPTYPPPQNPEPPPSQPPHPSQASSHFPLAPISGAVLFAREVARRDALVFGEGESSKRGARAKGKNAESDAEKKQRKSRRQGNLRTGCSEIDEQVLLGGFERGCVVGVSCEAVEGVSEAAGFGVVVALQTIARLLVFNRGDAGPCEGRSRVRIVTTMVASAMLPALRGAVEKQLGEWRAVNPVVEGEVDGGRKAQVRACLERVSISRVFEFEGLWEVLSELEQAAGEVEGSNATGVVDRDHEDGDDVLPSGGSAAKSDDEESQQLDDAPSEESELSSPPKSEIQDSEDEGLFSSSPAAVPTSPPVSFNNGPNQPPPSSMRTDEQPPPNPSPPPVSSPPPPPEIILITNMAALLSSLLTGREKSTSHTMLRLLSSRLQYISRAPEHGGPLILILNSTKSPDPAPPSRNLNPDAPMPPPRNASSSRPVEPTLRSIFNPPPRETLGYYTGGGGGGGGDALARRNKPTFGLLFSQMLDLHLLCTRVPRSREDAEAVFAPMSSPAGVRSRTREVNYVWVVECLLDEMGVWEGDEGKKRKSREQRWGAVDVDGGVVRDAFAKKEVVDRGEIRLAAGFGGRRV